MMVFRLATPDDAEAVRDIYAPFCAEDSHVSFEVEPPSVDEMRRRIIKTLNQWPWLVGEEEGEIVGYVYAYAHRERAAYRWSVDVSVYIHPGRRRSGLGRALYKSLFEVLRLQGYANAYAGTALPNPGSIGLHRAIGFEPVGVYSGVGYKGGSWHDVAWWQMALQERPDRPAEPVSLPTLLGTQALHDAIQLGRGLLPSS
jgi:L-amino acid N-acyltransferase YncA